MASERLPESSADLTGCFLELLAYVFFLRKICARQQPAFAEVKGRVEALLEESARRMRAGGVDPREYDDARFAVVAWVDETVLNMPWAHREEWQRARLQTVYYATTSAGGEFFERLNRLRPDEKGVREVYYLCLSLGFRGRYHSDEDAFLVEQLKKSNAKALLGASLERARFAQELLLPSAYDTGLSGEARSAGAGFWSGPRIALAAALPALVVLLFLVYGFVLGGVVDNLMTHVSGG